jgi:hypothetical protein
MAGHICHAQFIKKRVDTLGYFLSALLAMLVGIGMEYLKRWLDNRKSAHERLKIEVQQINTVIVGIGYNIDILIHLVFQSIIPHHQQTHEVYAALQSAGTDNDKLTRVFRSLGEYQALLMLCPEPFLIETDFFAKTAFITEKEPELVKQACWIISLSRILNNAIRDRNKNIEMARTATTAQGQLTFYQLDNILHLIASIADSECVTTLQLLEKLLSTARSLETLNAAYQIPDKKWKLKPNPALDEAMNQLRQIAGPIIGNAGRESA